jgi:Zn-finger nucleic acid-binding protein
VIVTTARGGPSLPSVVVKCPIDDTPLTISSRDGVEIDFCPQCRGVWLDRGELDKIIDRTAAALGSARSDDRDDDRDRRRDDRSRDDDRYRDDRGRSDDKYDKYDSKTGKKKKRGGFLEDLFDFG